MACGRLQKLDKAESAPPPPEQPEEAVCPNPDFGGGRLGGASGPGHHVTTSVHEATGFAAVCHSGHRTSRTEDAPHGGPHSALHSVWPGRGHPLAAWAIRPESRQEEQTASAKGLWCSNYAWDSVPTVRARSFLPGTCAQNSGLSTHVGWAAWEGCAWAAGTGKEGPGWGAERRQPHPF